MMASINFLLSESKKFRKLISLQSKLLELPDCVKNKLTCCSLQKSCICLSRTDNAKNRKYNKLMTNYSNKTITTFTYCVICP